MKSLLFAFTIVVSVVLTLASPLPREAPLFIVLLAFTVVPYRESMAIALGAGFLVDLFSPVAGLSVIAYPVAIMGVSFLTRQIFSHRSLLGFLILTLFAGVTVFVIKSVGFLLMTTVAGGDLFSLLELFFDSRGLFARAFATNVVYGVVLYGILSAVSSRLKTLSLS